MTSALFCECGTASQRLSLSDAGARFAFYPIRCEELLVVGLSPCRKRPAELRPFMRLCSIYRARIPLQVSSLLCSISCAKPRGPLLWYGENGAMLSQWMLDGGRAWIWLCLCVLGCVCVLVCVFVCACVGGGSCGVVECTCVGVGMFVYLLRACNDFAGIMPVCRDSPHRNQVGLRRVYL